MTRSEHPEPSNSAVVQRATAAGVTLVETRFAPDTILPEHWHEHAFFCLALRGPFRETTGGQILERRKHSILFHPPRETHADTFSSAGGACFNIELGSQWDDRLGELLPDLLRGRSRSGGTSTWYGERLLDELRRREAPSALTVEGLVLLLLADASRSYDDLDRWHPPAWLGRVRSYLTDAFRSRPTVAEAARLVGVHPVHVARVFARAHGCTIGDYVQRLRLAHACRLLATNDRSLSEIAQVSGFSDQSHLTRTLRRACGLTPGRFRRRLRGR
jgi:AraC family transcriptional regulator